MAPALTAAPPSLFPCNPSSVRNKDPNPNRCLTRIKSANFACNVQGKSFPQITVVPSPLFKGGQASRLVALPTISQRRKSMTCRQAFIYHSSGFRIPSTAEKPEWWWRTLSCIPYLMSLKMSDTGFYIQPFIENFKIFQDLVYYIPGAVNRLPTWFPMIYCYLAVVVVVKNKDLPLLFRFHVMMGILLEIALQVLWYSSNFMPLVHFNGGTFGMYYWAGVALAYVLIMMECIRCALLGTFVNIPLVSQSAFIHTLFHLGGLGRPF
ncbi:hypothetical protein QN277_008454 [Acacia crassicarpa]|uniref:Protein TIC 20 n=1 Tax=Acacia crassicarpa TaxID=499986 RepID=A0AAE1IS16_9FABA|nr:hypothetical protein QN277_008454 [Acacia crassicarpa]